MLFSRFLSGSFLESLQKLLFACAKAAQGLFRFHGNMLWIILKQTDQRVLNLSIFRVKSTLVVIHSKESKGTFDWCQNWVIHTSLHLLPQRGNNVFVNEMVEKTNFGLNKIVFPMFCHFWCWSRWNTCYKTQVLSPTGHFVLRHNNFILSHTDCADRQKSSFEQPNKKEIQLCSHL